MAELNKKKSKLQLTDEDTQKIIDLWSTKDVLFNCSNPDYFKKDSRAAALADIVEKADIAGLTTEELHKKLAGLRTYYGREIGKERITKVSGTGRKDVYVSKWPFFTSLHFLRDNITPRKTTSNLEPAAISTVVLNEDVPVDSVEDETKEENDENTSSVFKVNAPSRKTSRKLEDELLETCIKELKKPKQATSPGNDGDSIFGNYIASQLKKIPEGYRKEMLKLELQQCIMKAMIPTPARQPFATIDFSDLE